MGETRRVGDAPLGVGDAPQWATRRVAPTIRYDFWGAASLRPNVASLRPNVASLRPNVASLRPNVASLRPNVASLRPTVASLRPTK